MLESLVLTVIGPDRTGLVESIAAVVAEHQGNWMGSRLARLAGQFAGVVQVNVPSDKTAAMTAALQGLAERGLTVTVHGHADTDAATDAQHLRLELLGHDRPGIVREVAHALAAAGISVVELDTTCYSAPMSGEPIFKARAQLTAPPDVDLDALRDNLDTIADNLHLDLDLDLKLSD